MNPWLRSWIAESHMRHRRLPCLALLVLLILALVAIGLCQVRHSRSQGGEILIPSNSCQVVRLYPAPSGQGGLALGIVPIPDWFDDVLVERANTARETDRSAVIESCAETGHTNIEAIAPMFFWSGSEGFIHAMVYDRGQHVIYVVGSSEAVTYYCTNAVEALRHFSMETITSGFSRRSTAAKQRRTVTR